MLLSKWTICPQDALPAFNAKIQVSLIRWHQLHLASECGCQTCASWICNSSRNDKASWIYINFNKSHIHNAHCRVSCLIYSTTFWILIWYWFASLGFISIVSLASEHCGNGLIYELCLLDLLFHSFLFSALLLQSYSGWPILGILVLGSRKL